MVVYPSAALRRLMKVQEVILRAMSKEINWIQAAHIIGVSARSMRRWRRRYERSGYDGLLDRRSGRPSPRRAPASEVERILQLYRDGYRGFNSRHFWQLATRDHGVTLSYTYVKLALQGAGLVEKRKKRGRHHKRREPRSRFGEMLHTDGSKHQWLSLKPGEYQVMIAVLDDATKYLFHATLESGETTLAVMRGLFSVVTEHGIPMDLYTDRAGWAFHTPTAGGKVDKNNLTQVGRLCKQLGIDHIPAYSPQARGRGERLNRTLQDRLVNELRAAGVSSVTAANRYIREVFIPDYNRRFTREPKCVDSAFVKADNVDLHRLFCVEETRKVAKDNTVAFNGKKLQLEKQKERASCADLNVVVREHLDESISIWHGLKRLGAFNKSGKPCTNNIAGGALDYAQSPVPPTSDTRAAA